jgi:hypothetical protein
LALEFSTRSRNADGRLATRGSILHRWIFTETFNRIASVCSAWVKVVEAIGIDLAWLPADAVEAEAIVQKIVVDALGAILHLGVDAHATREVAIVLRGAEWLPIIAVFITLAFASATRAAFPRRTAGPS